MTGPIDRTLLPPSATVNADGRLSVGGCDLVELASGFGTPLIVYDEGALRARCREYAEQFGAENVFYASKAFLCVAMARLVESEGLGLDVATGGELYIALAAGFPPRRIVFHGNNKSEEELRRGLEVEVGRIVADSFDELDRIEALVASGSPAPGVLIRVTPGVEVGTHAHIQTGHEDSKFGFSARSGDALEAARRAAASPGMRFLGLHAHIGSQVFDLDSYEQTAQVVAELLGEIEAVTGSGVEEVNLGGGLGVAYTGDDRPPSVADYAAALTREFGEACARRGVESEPTLAVEPGRSIAGPAGLTLYRVGTIKDVAGVRTYVAVDGGMSDNPRPSVYGARYEAFLPRAASAERTRTVTVAGKHCEQGDVLIHDAALPADVSVGDVLCTPATGAYAYSMASNYNAQPRPAVVFVDGGEARVVVRRETVDDLLRLDQGD
ncbi:MAG: diaminopimelate decarboxylase [Actinobacteria bacterium]|nr:diaminopimelate decarboxylase [Actinomycetota bacterium]